MLSDLEVVLGTAISELGLPVAGTAPIQELTLEQMLSLATSMTELTEHVLGVYELEYCSTGLPENVITLVLGKYIRHLIWALIYPTCRTNKLCSKVHGGQMRNLWTAR